MPRLARTFEVCRLPIPHQSRGVQSPHDEVAPVSCGWSVFPCASWQIGHEAQRKIDQPQEMGAATLCGDWGSLWPSFLARSLISNVLIATSACVQVPEDTFFLLLGAAGFLLGHKRRHRSHAASCSIPNAQFLAHRRLSNILCRDCPWACTGQPGGLRK